MMCYFLFKILPSWDLHQCRPGTRGSLADLPNLGVALFSSSCVPDMPAFLPAKNVSRLLWHLTLKGLANWKAC